MRGERGRAGRAPPCRRAEKPPYERLLGDAIRGDARCSPRRLRRSGVARGRSGARPRSVRSSPTSPAAGARRQPRTSSTAPRAGTIPSRRRAPMLTRRRRLDRSSCSTSTTRCSTTTASRADLERQLEHVVRRRGARSLLGALRSAARRARLRRLSRRAAALPHGLDADPRCCSCRRSCSTIRSPSGSIRRRIRSASRTCARSARR